jgi:hypothetical protein
MFTSRPTSVLLFGSDLVNRLSELVDLVTVMIPRLRIDNGDGRRDHEAGGVTDGGCGARRGLHDFLYVPMA